MILENIETGALIKGLFDGEEKLFFVLESIDTLVRKKIIIDLKRENNCISAWEDGIYFPFIENEDEQIIIYFNKTYIDKGHDLCLNFNFKNR